MTFKEYKAWVMADPRSEKLDFTPDDRLHYVYRVTELTGDRRHYYGSRTDDNEPTIGCGYYSSSNDEEFCRAFKETPETYRSKVIRIFNNAGDKMMFESYLHRKFDVKNHDKFINRSNQTPWGFDVTGKIKGKDNGRARPIYELDRYNGEIIKQWECAADAANNYEIDAAGIRNCCYGLVKTSNDKVWCFVEDYDENFIDEIQKRSYDNKGSKSPNAKPVYELDLEGNIVKRWECADDAVKNSSLGVTACDISLCCSGKQKTARGRRWILVKDFENQKS